jgi:hypothetical protein
VQCEIEGGEGETGLLTADDLHQGVQDTDAELAAVSSIDQWPPVQLHTVSWQLRQRPEPGVWAAEPRRLPVEVQVSVVVVEREQAQLGGCRHTRQPAAHAYRLKCVLVEAGPGVVIPADAEDVEATHRLGDFLTAHPGTPQVGSVDDAARAEQERELEGNGHTGTVPETPARRRDPSGSGQNPAPAPPVQDRPGT